MLTALKQHYVNHTDGFTMHYGHPLNSDYINHQINLIRQHFFKMQRITVDEYLPQVSCPHNFIPGYGTQYAYYWGYTIGACPFSIAAKLAKPVISILGLVHLKRCE
jgi:hypothetical protein